MSVVAANTRMFAADTPVLTAITPGRVGSMRRVAAFMRVKAAVQPVNAADTPGSAAHTQRTAANTPMKTRGSPCPAGVQPRAVEITKDPLGKTGAAAAFLPMCCTNAPGACPGVVADRRKRYPGDWHPPVHLLRGKTHPHGTRRIGP